MSKRRWSIDRWRERERECREKSDWRAESSAIDDRSMQYAKIDNTTAQTGRSTKSSIPAATNKWLSRQYILSIGGWHTYLLAPI